MLSVTEKIRNATDDSEIREIKKVELSKKKAVRQEDRANVKKTSKDNIIDNVIEVDLKKLDKLVTYLASNISNSESSFINEIDKIICKLHEINR